jgi:cytoskeletal protein CcmA (bactofilin family)
MFKKSEEQEWTRFRGALSKDRDDNVSSPAVTVDANDAGAASPATAPVAGATPATPTAASFRTIPGDVNVGSPSARLSRGAGSDGSDVETLIGERTHFEGTLRAEGAVRLLGTIDGEIQSNGTIFVEEKSHVTARLTASQVTIAGEVDGQIYCDGRVEIRPTGRVTGEISAGALIVQEGAYFDGNSRMAAPGSVGGAAGSAGSGSSGAAGSHGAGSGSGSAGASAGAGARGSAGSASGSDGATVRSPA